MSMIPGNTLEKAIFNDGLQSDHLSENTVGHGVSIQGRTSGVAVDSGYIGQVITAANTAGTAVPSSNPVIIAQINITAGVWIISGIYNQLGNGTPSQNANPRMSVCYNGETLYEGVNQLSFPHAGSSERIGSSLVRTINISATTTYYLYANPNLASGYYTGYGSITATRIA